MEPYSLTPEQALLAFLERYWDDAGSAGIRPLRDYLVRWPGHEEAVAKEYLALAAPEAASMATGGESTGSKILDRGQLGPYRLLGELGRGGQGRVYLAVDTRLGRRVALKVLTGFGPGAEDMILRFRREAEVASRLEHPAICAVYETGIEVGVPFIAMRYVDGETLAQRIARLKSGEATPAAASFMTSLEEEAAEKLREDPVTELRAPPADVAMSRAQLAELLQIFEKAARALHAAHEAGVVHRDLKPANIIVTREGEPVLLDFGMARDDQRDGLTLTRTGDVFGTPAYMSPEQISGDHVRLDRRTDVYSLGVTLFECLTFRRPFEAPTRESLYRAIMGDEPSDPRRWNRSVPRDLKVVLETALEKERDRRYLTALDFAEDLRRVRELQPVAARPISPAGRALRWARRHPARAALVALLAIGIPLVGGLAGYVLAHQADIEATREQERLDAVETLLEEGYFEYGEGVEDRGKARLYEALRLDPECPEAVAGLVLSLAVERKDAEARSLLESSRIPARDPALHARLLSTLRQSGFVAVSSNTSGPVAPPATPLDCFVTGISLLEPGIRSEDRELCRRAFDLLSRAAFSVPRARRLYHMQLARAAGWVADPESSARVAQALTTLWPGLPSAWTWAGFALARCDREAATANYRRAIALDPRNHTAWNALGSLLDDLGRPVEAEAALIEAVRIHPLFARAHMNLGAVRFRLGRVEESIKDFREALRLDQSLGRAWYDLGLALGRGDRLRETTEAQEKATSLSPGFAPAWVELGQCFEALQRDEEALAAYDRAIELDPANALALTVRGILRRRRGDAVGAVADSRRAAVVQPETGVGWYNLGNALRHRGDAAEAEESYRKAIRIDATLAEAHCNLGRCLKDQGRFQEALAELREGHRLGTQSGARTAGGGSAPWGWPSATWVEECEHWVEAEARLAAILAGEPLSEDARGIDEVVEICRRQNRPVDEARLWILVFSAHPELALDPAAGRRFQAACAAVRAAWDESDFSFEARAEWRSRALDWLRLDLAAWEKVAASEPNAAGRLSRMLSRWTETTLLDPVREAKALEALPATERKAWLTFWQTVEDLQHRAGE